MKVRIVAEKDGTRSYYLRTESAIPPRTATVRNVPKEQRKSVLREEIFKLLEVTPT